MSTRPAQNRKAVAPAVDLAAVVVAVAALEVVVGLARVSAGNLAGKSNSYVRGATGTLATAGCREKD